MVYHYSQKLHSAGMKGVYKISTHNKVIIKFLWIVYVLMIRDRNKNDINNW